MLLVMGVGNTTTVVGMSTGKTDGALAAHLSILHTSDRHRVHLLTYSGPRGQGPGGSMERRVRGIDLRT